MTQLLRPIPSNASLEQPIEKNGPLRGQKRGVQDWILIRVRELLDEHGRLPTPAAAILLNETLYEAGLSSFCTVGLMLALEESFECEFPDRMLNRRTFATLGSIAASVDQLFTSDLPVLQSESEPSPPDL